LTISLGYLYSRFVSIEKEIELPTHKSAAKRIKTAAESRQKNRSTKTTIKNAIKSYVGEKDTQKKGELAKSVQSIVDKAAGRNVIHKNKASRIKSRLAKSAGSK